MLKSGGRVHRHTTTGDQARRQRPTELTENIGGSGEGGLFRQPFVSKQWPHYQIMTCALPGDNLPNCEQAAK